MANFDNQSVKELSGEMRDMYHIGLVDGYTVAEKKGRHITDWMYIGYVYYTPYQRGYLMGYGLWLEEQDKY